MPEVPPLEELLRVLERDEVKGRRWLAAPGEVRHFRVVHERVAIRGWPAISAPAIGLRRLGEIVRVVEMRGLWVRLHPDECVGTTVAVPREALPEVQAAALRERQSLEVHPNGTRGNSDGQHGWMLEDGAEVGLSQLLEPLEVHTEALQSLDAPAATNPWEFEVLRGLGRGMISLQDLGEELRDRREVVLAAVQRDGRALRHASEKLRADRAVVLAAVRQSPEALRFAAEELRSDAVLLVHAKAHAGLFLAAAGLSRQA